MRYRWLAAGLLVLTLPLIASALPRLVTIPVARADGAIEITFRIEGVSAAEQVAGVNFEIPTDVPGYEVIGGQILNPDEASPDWLAQFNPTASFRSSENDFFLSFFSCRRIDSESCDFQLLSSDFDIAVLTVRELQAGTAITLKPASAIGAIVNDETTGVSLGGQIVDLDPDPDGDGINGSDDNCPSTFNPGQENGDQFPAGNLCQCGDVSDDGIVDILDTVLLRRALANLPPGLVAPAKCEVTPPEGCGVEDAVAMREALAGLPTLLEQICPAAQASGGV